MILVLKLLNNLPEINLLRRIVMDKVKIVSVVTISILILLVSAIAFGDMNYGVKGGISVMRIAAQSSSTGGVTILSESLVGFVGGVYAYNNISNNSAVQGELLFITKGSKADYSSVGIDAVEKDRIMYIEIPVLLKYIFVKSDNYDASLYVGPALSIFLNMVYELTGVDAYLLASTLGVPTNGTYKDLGLELHNFDFNLCFGIDAAYKVSNGQIKLDLRYDFGLTDIYKSDTDATSTNRGFLVMVGYEF